MSVYSQIVRILGLRDRIANKLISLGLINRVSGDPDLEDCTEAVEDINEVTPYLISTTGVKNVAAYKYAQIDETAWVPAGSTPIGLKGVVTGLGSTGILSSSPTNFESIGTVYPPTGYQGMSENNLIIDTDVIKPENIKKDVQILGVTGTYEGNSNVNYIETTAFNVSVDNRTITIFNVPFSRISDIKHIDIMLIYGLQTSSNTVLSMSAFSNDINYPTTTFLGVKEGGSSFYTNFDVAIVQDQNNHNLTITAPSGMYFANPGGFMPAAYSVCITYTINQQYQLI